MFFCSCFVLGSVNRFRIRGTLRLLTLPRAGKISTITVILGRFRRNIPRGRNAKCAARTQTTNNSNSWTKNRQNRGVYLWGGGWWGWEWK